MGRELRKKNAPDDVSREREDRMDEIIARAKKNQPDGAGGGDSERSEPDTSQKRPT